MFSRLFARRGSAGKAQAPAAAAPALDPPTPETTLYAIGDLHGRLDLLLGLMESLLAEADDWEGPPDLVFLGDCVDRTEGVRDLLDFLLDLADRGEMRCHFLMGNHERMLLRFLGDPVAGRSWLAHGAAETLASYGLDLPTDTRDEAMLRDLRDRFAAALGAHRGFLEAMRPYHRSGNLLLAHAGADPWAAPEAQSERALLWGHPDFGIRPRGDGLWVVHGHSLVDEARIADGRIALDTGAWFSGRLSAARIAAGRVAFLATDSGEIDLAADWTATG